MTLRVGPNLGSFSTVSGRIAIRTKAGSRYKESSRPLPAFTTRRYTTSSTQTTTKSMVTSDELTKRLEALSLAPTAKVAHPAVTNPAEWKDILAQTPGAPASFELCKTLVFKPKTAKTATPVPVVVIARDETETNSGALGKKFNLKDLRLAADDLLAEFFSLDKHSCMYSLSNPLISSANTTQCLPLHSPRATLRASRWS